MKFLNTKPKKILFWTFSIIILLIALVIAFISPLTKWAIEKYDVKYSGREITLDLAYVNPFTGYIYFKNIEIYEENSDSLFFSAKSISSNFEMVKLLSKTYEISELTLTDPKIKIIQNKKEFNFNDLVEKFTSKDTLPKKHKEPTHFNLLNVKIKNGTFYYLESSIPVNYFIKDVNIETNGKRWDADTMGFRFSFVSGIGGGDMKGMLDLNTSSLDYKLATLIHKFDLSALEQYVKDIANYGKVRGNLDGNLNAEGNFKSSQKLNAKGFLAVNDFHFGKNKNEDYLSFKKLTLGIAQLSPSNKKYMFDSILLLNPYFKYEQYDHLDNLQYMFGKNGEKADRSKHDQAKVNILYKIGDYVKLLAKNFFKSDYKVKRLAIFDADLRYNDFSLTEEFSTGVSPLTIIADSIERSDKWVGLSLHAGLKPYGNMKLDLSINPKDSSDFVIKYVLEKIPMAMFNPYFITYTSFPLDRGIIEIKGEWHVNNGIIDSKNNILVIDPRINIRQERNGAKWLPLRFFMFFVRDRGNVIDFEVPVKGNLKDPKFKLREVILDILRNVFVKPVTIPYRTEVRNVENEIEKTITLKWSMRHAKYNPPEDKFIRNIAGFLEKNPNASISVQPEFYMAKEKEYILFFEAKKRFYLSANHENTKGLTDDDSTTIEKISVKDSSFRYYLDKNTGKNHHTAQEQCLALVGYKNVDRVLKQLAEARRAVFLSYFNETTGKQIKIKHVKDTIPFNGFSLYRISYKGGFPQELTEAYQDINELDNNSPRNKFKAQRVKNRNLLDVK